MQEDSGCQKKEKPLIFIFKFDLKIKKTGIFQRLKVPAKALNDDFRADRVSNIFILKEFFY